MMVQEPPNKAAAQIVPSVPVTMLVSRRWLSFGMTALSMFATLALDCRR
jgi:hypothetical protein